MNTCRPQTNCRGTGVARGSEGGWGPGTLESRHNVFGQTAFDVAKPSVVSRLLTSLGGEGTWARGGDTFGMK